MEIEELSDKITEYHQDAKKYHEKLDKILFGNGSVGWDTRIDRLEQSKKSRDKLLGAIGFGVVGLAVRAVWTKVMG